MSVTPLFLALVVTALGPPRAAPSPDVATCAAPMPPAGAVLHGPVLHVVDGATLCIALGAGRESWTPLVVAASADANAAPPPDRGTLMAVAFAQNATCEVVGAADGVAIAQCEVAGLALGDQLASPEAVRAGRTWR